MSGRRVKRLGETNSALLHQIQTSVDVIINPIDMVGGAGFVISGGFGVFWSVAFSDVDALIYVTFFVRQGGDFKLQMTHSGGANNFGNTAGANLFISYDVDGGLQTWNTNRAWNIPLEDDRILQITTEGTAITLANNSHLGIYWEKNDNAGGAGADMRIFSIVLVRQ